MASGLRGVKGHKRERDIKRKDKWAEKALKSKEGSVDLNHSIRLIIIE